MKKSSKQMKTKSKEKNTRHHISTTSSILKKNSTKAKLRNDDLRSRLDKATGLAGAINLFAPNGPLPKPQSKVTEKEVEDDIIALMSLKLATTKAH
jgi:hypothetical protein